MNRIEKKLNDLKEKNEKAFITYITAGLPDMEGTKDVMRAQYEAGTDIIELGVPFSDPCADGPVIQAASYEAIQKGSNLKSVFKMVKELRQDCEIPIVFMLYYNTVFYYGVEKFVDSCIENGVDGFIIPDLPLEEQGEIKGFLGKPDAPLMIQLAAPISRERIKDILDGARGFLYCVSSMGVTGDDSSFYKDIRNYLKSVKEQCELPIMMGFGINEASDVNEVKDIIDGAIVGSHLITIMKNSDYDLNVIREYCSKFKRELNSK